MSNKNETTMYKIRPIWIGQQGPVDMSMMVYKYPAGQQQIMVSHGVFAIDCEDETILYDTGLPPAGVMADLGYTCGVCEDNPDFVSVLRENGIEPDQIRTVIQSHLHWDHCWNMKEFPNARFYIQKKELAHALNPLPHEKNSFCHFPKAKKLPVFDVFDRLVVIDGDYDLRPGIRLKLAAGHTEGFMIAIVDTNEGQYGILGDFFMNAISYEQDNILGLFCDGRSWYENLKIIKSMNLKGVLISHGAESYQRKVIG